jgi:poly-gamma-glutamate system protein
MESRARFPGGKPFSAPPASWKYRLILTALLGLVLYVAALLLAPLQNLPYNPQMKAAASTMARALEAIRTYKVRHGFPFPKSLDPNQTGIVGPRKAAFATSLGNLEAKRTTTNPNMAALITHLLQQAGIGEDDRVALGNSGSFPALMIASMAAVQSLKAHPLPIISLGASSYGATEDHFNLLDIYMLLYHQRIFKHKPVAVSWGGEGDLGQEYDTAIRRRLEARIHSLAIPLIVCRDLQQNINTRMSLYQEAACGEEISVFINSGGNEANLGQDAAILKVKPGLNMNLDAPAKENRGILFEMAAAGIPCIHLLFIKGLSQAFGLPWDPIPLPGPAEHRLRNPRATPPPIFWIISIIYFAGIIILLIYPLVSQKQ